MSVELKSAKDKEETTAKMISIPHEKVKTKKLSYEEKYCLMEEYIRTTGKPITVNTQYKGYNIGTMKMYIRQLYFKGELYIDEELLRKYKELGIITDKKQKNKSSPEDKYNFLMSLVSMSEDERIKHQMKNGLTYREVKVAVQSDYNKGKLKLTEKQIQNLLDEGFLKISSKEKDTLEEKYDLLIEYALIVESEYKGSYKKFMEAFKKGELELVFKDNRFVGERAVVVSSEELTQRQKIGYCKLYKDIMKTDNYQYKNGVYINVDAIKEVLMSLDTGKRTIIERGYGLVDGSVQNGRNVANELGYTYPTVRTLKYEIVKNINRIYGQHLTCNFLKLYEQALEYNREYQIIISNVLNSDGTCKERQDINFNNIIDELGLDLIENNILKKIEELHSEQRAIEEELRKLEESKQQKYNYVVYSADTPIEELGFSLRTFNCLKRAGVNTVGELIRKSKEEFMKIKKLGQKTYQEIFEKKSVICLDESDLKEKIRKQEELKNQLEPLFKQNVVNLVEYLETMLIEKIAEYILTKERCDRAVHNYLYMEDILDPEGVIPAVEYREVTQQEIMEVLNSLNNSDKTNNKGVKQEFKSVSKLAQVIRTVSVNDAETGKEFLDSITIDKQIEGVDYND